MRTQVLDCASVVPESGSVEVAWGPGRRWTRPFDVSLGWCQWLLDSSSVTWGLHSDTRAAPCRGWLPCWLSGLRGEGSVGGDWAEVAAPSARRRPEAQASSGRLRSRWSATVGCPRSSRRTRAPCHWPRRPQRRRRCLCARPCHASCARAHTRTSNQTLVLGLALFWCRRRHSCQTRLGQAWSLELGAWSLQLWEPLELALGGTTYPYSAHMVPCHHTWSATDCTDHRLG